MRRMYRRHPFLVGLVVLALSPYLLALALAFALVYGLAVALDMLTED